MRSSLFTAVTALLLASPARAANTSPAQLQRQFDSAIRPFLQGHCLDCHGKDKPKGQLDLSGLTDMPSVRKGLARLLPVAERLESREMPPAKAKAQPSDQARAEVLAWIRAVRAQEARRSAGDPGTVLARRLSNAEYDYTIRDLTGVDIRPTREFPVDPANEAGFDNSGESLMMSPGLLKKYLDAARGVADHLVLAPKGVHFAPHPVVTDTDRDRYAVERIVQFYERQPTDLGGYFHAAWRFQHRAARGKPRATLASVANETGVSAGYLTTVWSALTQKRETFGPLARVQEMFRALPAPPAEDAARTGCQKLGEFVTELRANVAPVFDNLKHRTVSAGSQPFVLWKNTQRATHRTSCDKPPLYVPAPPDPQRVPPETIKAAAGLAMAVTHFWFRNIVHDSALPIPFGVHELAATMAPPDPELAIPDEGARPRHQAAFARFCHVFPDAFYVAERGRTHLDQPRDRKQREEKGRLLSAGYHNMFGFFRDDIPLVERVLDAGGRRELDQLWRELDFITLAPMRQHADFIFYERAESKTIKGPAFDFVRSEDKSATSQAMIRRLAAAYLELARSNEGEDNARTIPILEHFFEQVSANVRRVENERLEAEPSHLDALLAIAGRAYRRSLTSAERTSLLAFYKSARADGLEHDTAIRDTLARVLMSPHFLYRTHLQDGTLIGSRTPRALAPAGEADMDSGTLKGFRTSRALATAGEARLRLRDRQRDVSGNGVRPLDDHALASRLSYFLWSSMPDAELLARATKRTLHQPAVLAAQARRMLRDHRARALAVEFAGQWLDFRRFEEHNAVDRERFPGFDAQLRQAMFEEPVRFFDDVARQNRSVLDFLYGQHTFVNAPLARHYGMPASSSEPSKGSEPPAMGSARRSRATPDANGEWVRVDDAGRYQRGGLLPMAVFLTKNAPGLRTSPVKRGYWVVRRVLGEHIPAPPAQVPELPSDERKLGDLTLREMLARHRENEACAGCHARFDSFGLAFEGYGPVGEVRQVDLGGRPVETQVPFPGGQQGSGLAGLRDHLRAARQGDFLDNLCRKLLSYALGRGLMLSDEPTIERMRARLAADGHRFGGLVDTIVRSPQFLTRRGAEYSASREE